MLDPNQIYIFKKSGNKVKIIAGTESKVRANPNCPWIPSIDVARVDTGKQMVVSISALITLEEMQKLDPDFK